MLELRRVHIGALHGKAELQLLSCITATPEPVCQVTDECCDEPTEDCSSGYPASCNADCAKVRASKRFSNDAHQATDTAVVAWQVLLPVQEACTEFLHGPGMKPILSSINTAAATCQSGH